MNIELISAVMAKPECTDQFIKEQGQELCSSINHLKRFTFHNKDDERKAWDEIFECFGTQVEDVEMMREIHIQIRNAE